jgi:O-antigen/teichoic acid export membrane protein
LSGLALLGYLLVAQLLEPELAPLYGWGGLAIILAVISTVQLSEWQANFESRWFATTKIMTTAGTLIASLIFLQLQFPATLALCVGVVSGFGVAVAMGYFTTWRRKRLHLSLNLTASDKQIAKRFIIYGTPFIGWFIGTQILSVSDRFVLGLFSDVATVGAYSAIYSLLSGLTSFLAMPIILVAHPAIVASWARISSKMAQTNVLAYYTRLFWIVCLPAVVCLIAASPLVVRVLIPNGYAADHVLVTMLTLGLLANMYGLLAHKGLEMAERTQQMLKLVAICAVANLILNVALIPMWSAHGAALATMLSYFLYVLIAWQSSRHYLLTTLNWKSMGRIGVASCGVFVVTRFLVISLEWLPDILTLVAVAVASVLVYVGLLVILNEIPLTHLRHNFWATIRLGQK